MDRKVLKAADCYSNARRRVKCWYKIVICLAAVVVFCTTYAMILPAITMDQTAYCGAEAHHHTSDCYEKQLICGYDIEAAPSHIHTDDCYKEETILLCTEEPSPGHVHDDSCIETEKILTCTNEDPDHVHDDSCYEIAKHYICGQEAGDGGHTHGPECFETRNALACEIPEEAHIHTDACYEDVLVCGQEEHEHTLACYSDPDADVESQSMWERSVSKVELTGIWEDDVIAIAESQLGYQESTKNYIVTDEGKMQGYSRYGAWYGDPYGDWCAMFVSFCLNYAKIPENAVPYEASCPRWVGMLSKVNCGLYQNVGSYAPKRGDIIFFDWDGDGSADHVGLVAELRKYNTIRTIEGNADNCVQYASYDRNDTTILGYAAMPANPKAEAAGREEPPAEEPATDEVPEGEPPAEEPATDEVSEGEPPAEEPPAEEAPTEEPATGPEESAGSALPTREDLLDCSNGPAVFIFAERSPEEQAEVAPTNEPEETPMTFSARSVKAANSLTDYLSENGGSYSFTLLDQNNQALPTDEEGNYIVSPDTQYKLTFTVNSPSGFKPGTYTYQLPEGLTVNGGSGPFILNGIEVGTWTVDSTGLVTFVFNDTADDYSDVTISATMGVTFSESDIPIDFDGKITVVVQKPPEEEKTTELSKWGHQGDSSEGENPSKIYWTIEMLGNKDSNIPGSTITDSIISGNHTYTASDMANGLTFMASQRDPETGEEIEDGWHKWTVSKDDPNLTWTDTGWTYTIPETVICKYCGELTLGNENWWYWVQYTSTPAETDTVGSVVYQNHVTVDGQETDGWASIKHGQSDAGLVKTGVFQGGTNGGSFQWDVQVTIPGMKAGEPATYFWYLWDAMRVKDAGGNTIGYITNDMNLSEVTVRYDGQTITVPKLADATANDQFAWDSTWEDDHGDGIYYGRQIDFFHRCDCTADTCQVWDNGECGHEYYKNDIGNWVKSDFCRCWTLAEDAVFTFRYETDDPAVIEKYGGSGNLLQNEVSLNYKRKDESSNWVNTGLRDAEARVSIPGLFKKELTQDYNGYIAKYTITVNEAKLQLTEDGSQLTIHDVMTETLAYISGSLIITTEDAGGNTGTLTEGTDYTVTYDGSGNVTDNAGKPVHVLDIVILHPAAVQYTLNYDAALIIPSGTTGGVAYSNSASITLFGKTYTSDSDEKIYADINISAKNYSVQIQKTDEGTRAALPGAVFGLYNEHGGLIASGTTDEKGQLTFSTNVTLGIILQEHTPYYIQEITAPTSYLRSDTKYWIYFCDDKQECSYTTDIPGIKRIPGDQVGVVEITNSYQGFELPETGGTGTKLYTMGGFLLITGAVVPLLYNHKKHRKEDLTSS